MKSTWEGWGKLWTHDTTRIEALKYLIRQATTDPPLWTLYRDLQTELWPEYDHHEWSDLILHNIVEERVTTICGPKDTSKTNSMARFALCDYFCFPKETLLLMSSTDLRGLELRVWGEVKDLFMQAKEKWPEAPGWCVDSLHGIFTDQLNDEANVRDIRKGLICLPVVDSDGQWTGMRRWVGVKQKRRRVFADELQFYPAPYLSTLSNLNKGNFKFIGAGNPIGEGDPLDKLSEPIDGWDSLPEISTTTTWKTKAGGVTVQLYGPDSPAIKHQGKHEYLLNAKDIERIIDFYGKDSSEYWNQGIGVRRPGMNARRVLTKDMAKQFGALEEAVWKGTPTIKCYGLDAAYGGDRTVGTIVEFGADIDGKTILKIYQPRVIPVKLYPKSVPEELRVSAEDQIASAVRAECEYQNIPPKNVFFDSTGRGSLGTAFSRKWSSAVNPVEFGGSPSERPVSSDLFVVDKKTAQRRLKKASEHYSKRVTELWFAVRYAVESGQIREFPETALDEFAAREYGIVKGDKYELESKEDMKPRFGRSPDLADSLSVAVEGARQRGFQIARMDISRTSRKDLAWKNQLKSQVEKERASYTLSYS